MSLSEKLAGKTAIVTGAAQGIGRGIALRLARDGAAVVLTDLKKDKLKAVAAEIEAFGGKAHVQTADVSQREDVFAAVQDAAKVFGHVDIMVNNAGIAQVGAVLDATAEDVETIFRINVQGTLWGIQAAAQAFKNQKSGGKIINACSIAGHEGYAFLGIYSATKFAVRALTQAAAKELASSGITVNAYCPGVVGTDMWTEIDRRMAETTGAEIGETYKKYVEGITLGRVETPEDVAGFVSYLASTDADYMTGQSVMIDGGLVFR
ncbi:acetoin reductase [Acetobacter orleanensis]|uniref:diacetyl reductase [(S)-acetoin forming] n=1 Tax=Acetobacter orleanensis TaxID=104099 RepID=A0A4Y3TQA2_9PROT|nr:acetoin reductase [Acetobacter orleanensis]KXV62777.1 diacetyl reductase [Acetobacter orleanensis]PCD79282.1 diacetyl reductase [Acetobacter orleanensis]GAN68616.1 oxidoreductase/short-chain dehydrogenase/reductase SDR [Acetobacter orleanensis JCM 7639]GEB83247.1 diacetyl reductase [Acetobacter orleanensis]